MSETCVAILSLIIYGTPVSISLAFYVGQWFREYDTYFERTPFYLCHIQEIEEVNNQENACTDGHNGTHIN